MSQTPERKTMTAETQNDWFDPDATTFGDRLAGAREAAGMTQKEMAQRLGVKLKTLQGWEDDVTEPRANKLSTVSGLLNVSLRWLLMAEGDGPEAPADAEDNADVTAMMTEIRALRTQIVGSAERLGRLEKTLRKVLQDRA
ncbi:helix-turn-helix transcriptional regulator [Roseovarius sp. SK2]|uniref:helix-turn-helix domain-containing protein n=2 Tax=Roseovarius TaxID=74030 RepID=UPI00273DE6D6|nr:MULTISPECIES: helix-turn-helix transcriptional regulator [unclassified Roseovarius]MDD9724369.1 helix-turn-helix transcriptional regulator [Roseovarius sp. SK2]